MSLFIRSTSSNTYFNLAAEAHLLHEFEEDVTFVYVNRPAVVVGKHQNVFDECRISKCNSLGIDIARRLSGGGTVYHGPGNINFCFIKHLEPGAPLVDFKKHLQPVLDFLHSVGLPATYSGRNDLLLNGYKISGNAEHVFQKKRRLIHHGTLLFDADLESLKGSIQPKEGVVFTSHAVKSVRSDVANIRPYLTDDTTVESFTDKLCQFLIKRDSAIKYSFSQEDDQAIEKLVDDKFQTWDWIFGYSPGFEVKSHDGWLIEVKKGIIQKALKHGKEIAQLTLRPFAYETFEADFAGEAAAWF